MKEPGKSFIPTDQNGFKVFFSPLVEKGRFIKMGDAPLIYLSSEDEYGFFFKLYTFEDAFPHIMIAARKRLNEILNKF